MSIKCYQLQLLRTKIIEKIIKKKDYCLQYFLILLNYLWNLCQGNILESTWLEIFLENANRVLPEILYYIFPW